MRFSGQKCETALQASMSVRYGIKMCVTRMCMWKTLLCVPHDSFVEVNVEYL